MLIETLNGRHHYAVMEPATLVGTSIEMYGS